ncbi:MAG: hypothetical protein IJX71_01800 [Oscillospiraceae bacterium]|nr:hypothetical protein [Oscillospiraceae bacterium]
MAEEPNTQAQQPTEPQTQQSQTGSAPAFDYDKLAGILAGRQAANEESVLKGYFKQQGITGEEAAQAIAAFKAEKAKNTPDLAALQQENQQLRAQMLQNRIQNEAMNQARSLGVAPETVPYLIRLADLSAASNDQGEINAEAITTALSQVLEDLPQLKARKDDSRGFVPVGGSDRISDQGTRENRERGWFGLPPKK